MLLSGEPGIGKSRLTQTVRERLGEEPHVRLRYQCSPQHRNTALHPIIDHLERAAGLGQDDAASVKLDKLLRLLAPSTEDAAAAVPLLADLLSIPTEGRHPPLALAPQRRKELTLEALIDQLRGLAAHRPVLLVFEDAHWADPTTLELMDRLIDGLRKLPVLTLITSRPEFRPPWVGSANVSTLAINRLARPQSAALAERVTGGKTLPPEVLEQIVARTDGVPLFVEELTKTVLEGGLLRDAGDRYVPTGPLPPPAIPSTLHDSLMARLDRSAAMREVAQIGAAIGREISHELLAAVAPAGAVALDRGLAELVASELVSRHGVPPHAVYTFKHALVQDAAYQSLLRSRRQPLHARIADVLEQRFPDTAEAQPELLAHHFAEADLPERAIGYWRRASEQAMTRSGTTEALAHIGSGLAALEGLPPGATQQRLEVDLRLALGETLRAAKGTAAPETEAAFRRAREVCEQSGDDARLAQALNGLALYHYNRAELAIAHTTGSEFLALAERGGEPVALRQAHQTLGYVSFALGRPTAARSHLEKAAALAPAPRQDAGPVPPTLDRQAPSTLVYLSWSLWVLGYPDQASRRCRDGLDLAARSPDPFAVAMAVGNAATFHQLRRDAASARREAERLIALARARGIPYWTAWGELIRGWAVAEEGQAEVGLAVMRRATQDLRSSGYRIQVPYTLALQAGACGKAGRPDEGLALLREARGAVERTGERSLEAELNRMEAELLLARGAGCLAEAERYLGRALAVAHAQKARLWELRAAASLARLWRDRGRHAEASDLLAPIYGRFAEGFGTLDLIEAKGLLVALGGRG